MNQGRSGVPTSDIQAVALPRRQHWEGIGAQRAVPTDFPTNEAITAVEEAAKQKAASGAFSLDAILFGKWRD